MGRCSACGGILAVVYPDEVVNQLAIIHPARGLDHFRPLLPVSTLLPTLGEGDTPLLLSRRIGPAFGLQQLYFKVEGCNPTGAFKDRAAALIAALAIEAGAKGVVTASSGNSAAAISAYCAAAGLACLILIEPGSPPVKLRQTLITGAQITPVEGLFQHGPEAIGQLILKIAEALHFYPAFAWAPVNPYIMEGIKTLAYEVVVQLPGAPDLLVCPVGGGDMLTAQWRGYLELKRVEMIEKLPRLAAVQAAQAAPLLRAFREGAERVATLAAATSKVSGINVPFSGEHALKAVRESEGTVIGVEDEAVFEMQRRLALEEGLWVEPVSAAPVAALAELLAQGQLQPEARIVCILSGAGFKDSSLAEAEAQAIVDQRPAPFEVEAIIDQVRSPTAFS
jgi:threonine synthase